MWCRLGVGGSFGWRDVDPPQTRYAQSGDINIAYQVTGQGSVDLVYVPGWVSNVEANWEEPSYARFLERLSSFARLIAFDKRGTGLSDRIPEEHLPTLEERMDDVRAVMDAVGSERAALLGVSEGGPMCALFAATYPDRTSALVVYGTYARRGPAPDYPWGRSQEEQDDFLREVEEEWGGPVALADRAPSMARDERFVRWWAGYLRQSASPAAVLALSRMNYEVDVRHVLPSIHVPALVLHRDGDRVMRTDEARYIADHVPGSEAGRSTRPETASWRPSTDRPAGSGAPCRSLRTSGASVCRSEPAFTRGSASSRARISEGSPSTSGLAWPHWRRPGRFWCPRRSGTWSRDRGSDSMTGVSTTSGAFPSGGACSPRCPRRREPGIRGNVVTLGPLTCGFAARLRLTAGPGRPYHREEPNRGEGCLEGALTTWR